MLAFLSVTAPRISSRGGLVKFRQTCSFLPAHKTQQRPCSAWLGSSLRWRCTSSSRAHWFAFLGGGGILGVGPSEMAVILAVGWFILGPQKLFSLSRDFGKLIGDLRRSAAEARTTFTDAMEIELAAEESKKQSSLVGTKDSTGGADDYGASVKSQGTSTDDVSDIDGPANALNEMDFAAPNGVKVADNREDVASTLGLNNVQNFGIADNAPSAELQLDESDMRLRFVDQLKRASDPLQMSAMEADDIMSAEAEEEDVEVARLEYELAKARLAAKRKRNSMQSTEAPVTKPEVSIPDLSIE